MPLYTYFCKNCGKRWEIVHSMNEVIDTVCCGQTIMRDFRADIPNVSGRDYRTPIISDSLAINPEQRIEHERLFPDVKLTPQGQPVFENYNQHESYLKKTGFVKVPKQNRRKFTSKIGGKKNRKAKKAKVKG